MNGSQAFILATGKGGSGGGTNYNDLTNLPSVNGHTIEGAMTGDDLGLVSSDEHLEADQLAALISLL